MSDTTRKIKILLDAEDSASTIFAKATANIKRNASDMKHAFTSIPSASDTFKDDVAQYVKGREAAMERAAYRHRLTEAGERAMFGDPNEGKPKTYAERLKADVEAAKAEYIKAMEDDGHRAKVAELMRIDLFGTAEQTKEEGRKAGRSLVDGLKDGAKHKGKGGEEEGGFLESIKGAFGRGSAMQEIGELLKGGGVALGLSEGGRLLNEWAREAANVKRELAEGKVSAGEVVEKLAGGVPVYGELWQAGRSIRELMTDELAKAKEITDEAENTNKFLDARKAIMEHTVELQREWVDATKKAQRDVAAQTLSGPALEAFNAKNQHDDALEALKVKRKNDIQKERDDNAAELARLRKEYGDAAAKIPSPVTRSQIALGRNGRITQSELDSLYDQHAKARQEAIDKAEEANKRHKEMADRVQGNVDTINTNADKAEKGLADRLKGQLTDINLRKLVESNNRAKAFRDYGKQLMADMVEGIKADVGTVADQLRKSVDVGDLLREEGESILKMRADAGDFTAKAEIARLAAEKDVVEQRRKLMQVVFGLDADLKQRMSALNQLKELKSLTGSPIDRARANEFADEPSPEDPRLRRPSMGPDLTADYNRAVGMEFGDDALTYGEERALGDRSAALERERDRRRALATEFDEPFPADAPAARPQSGGGWAMSKEGERLMGQLSNTIADLAKKIDQMKTQPAMLPVSAPDPMSLAR